jgi:putative membrane protein
LFGTGYSDAVVSVGVWGFLLAGLIFSIINSVLKPITIILALPAILLTLGLFMLVVNGFMVYISLQLAPGLSMTFFNSILTGVLLSLINYIVSAALELRQAKEVEERS